MSSKWLRRCALFGVCVLVLAPSALPQKGKNGGGGASRAIVSINDAFPGTGAGVLSDGKGAYTDHLLSGGDPCVNAFVKADGFFNIQMDFSSDVGYGCNATLGTVAAGTARTYVLRFPAGHAACTQFNLASDGSVCALALDPDTDDPIIGIPKLFNSTPSQVRFRFRNGGNYWVVALTGVEVHPSQNPQTVSHIGPAKLFNDDKGKTGGYQVGGEFTFALEITVERVP